MVTEQIQGSVRAVGRAFTVATSSATIRNAGAMLLDQVVGATGAAGDSLFPIRRNYVEIEG